MWIFSKDGFFSAVFDKYCKSGESTRTRKKRSQLYFWKFYFSSIGCDIQIRKLNCQVMY